MVDITRKQGFQQKKTRSVSSARVTYDMVEDATLHELFNLPPSAVIVDSMVVVEVAGQTDLTVDFGFDGGNELGNDLDIDGTGVVSVPEVSTVTTLTGTVTGLTLTEGTPNTLSSGTVALTSGAGTVTKVPRIATGTGKTVTAKFSEAPESGTFVFIVEYVEYDLANGQLTNVG